ncbi:MAG: RNA polymerase sigma factor [Solidesulfovibrio sp.]
MDDQKILKQVREGDSEAYALLVRKYHRDLLGFIFRIVRDRHLAEDIGQDVFLSAYKALPRFDPDRGTPFMAWLHVMARNRCVSALRKCGRTKLVPVEDAPELAGDGPSPEARLIGRQEHEALAASIEKLEEPFRSTILMSLQGELLENIACRCGVPTATVKTRLFRAREKLRRLLTAPFGGVCHERPL